MTQTTKQQIQQILDKITGLESRLDSMEARMATKDDLKNMATKDDIKNMATKDDLKSMATKTDLKNLENSLTGKFYRKIDEHNRVSIEHHLRILEEIGHLNQQFTKLSDSQEELGRRFHTLRIVAE